MFRLWGKNQTQRLITKGDIMDLPKNIEELMLDADVPRLWEEANGKKYKPAKDPCVNDLRRFALRCFYHWRNSTKK